MATNKTALHLGNRVKCVADANVYNTEIDIPNIEGTIVAILADRCFIEISKDSLNNLTDEYKEYCDTNNLKRELALVGNYDFKLIDDKVCEMNFIFKVADNSNWKDLLVGIIMLGIAFIPSLFAIRFIYILLSGSAMPADSNIWAVLIPTIMFVIALSLSISFIRSYILHKRILLSKSSAICTIIDLYVFKVGHTERYEFYYLLDNFIFSQKVSYFKFKKFKIGDKVKVKYIENKPHLAKIVF